jgi:hypothetical protein
VSDEEYFRPLKKGRRHVDKRATLPPAETPAYSDYSMEDQTNTHPYTLDNTTHLVNGDGRTASFLKSTSAVRRRRIAVVPGLRTYVVLGSLFSLSLLMSGSLLPAAVVALTTLILVVVARARR